MESIDLQIDIVAKDDWLDYDICTALEEHIQLIVNDDNEYEVELQSLRIDITEMDKDWQINETICVRIPWSVARRRNHGDLVSTARCEPADLVEENGKILLTYHIQDDGVDTL